MDALVMAGGRGSRLKMGEKPLVTLFGRPLIDYVALALEESTVGRIYVATTENVPANKSLGRKQGSFGRRDTGKGICRRYGLRHKSGKNH